MKLGLQTDACKKKNKLYAALKKNPTFQNEHIYKRYKNKLTNVLRRDLLFKQIRQSESR